MPGACKPPVSYSNPRSLAEVHEPLRSRLHTAELLAPRGGLILVSGKRTDYMQWLLRHDRCPGRECDRSCKGSPTTALPGRSNHRNISAKIAAGDMGGIDLDWMGQHERELGLHRPVPGEKWHFECDGDPIWKIIDFAAGGNPNEGHHWVGFGPGDFDGVNGPVYKRGGYDNQVAEVQIRLKKLIAAGWKVPDPGVVDGIFGDSNSKTAKATSGFHREMVKVQEATGMEMWGKPDAVWGTRKIAALRWFAN